MHLTPQIDAQRVGRVDLEEVAPKGTPFGLPEAYEGVQVDVVGSPTMTIQERDEDPDSELVGQCLDLHRCLPVERRLGLLHEFFILAVVDVESRDDGVRRVDLRHLFRGAALMPQLMKDRYPCPGCRTARCVDAEVYRIDPLEVCAFCLPDVLEDDPGETWVKLTAGVNVHRPTMATEQMRTEDTATLDGFEPLVKDQILHLIPVATGDDDLPVAAARLVVLENLGLSKDPDYLSIERRQYSHGGLLFSGLFGIDEAKE